MAVSDVLEFVREDDFVEYYLFPPIESNDDNEQECILTSLLSKANNIINKYTNNYLWHKDEFKLIPRTSVSNYLDEINGLKEYLPPHLYGVSHYGDNIEDEWFMVFILHKLTKELTGLIARVYDSDGEFILIEAADSLPKWANPETCENRVYIYDGNIHLIPPTTEQPSKITIMEALSKIRSHPEVTLAPPDIQCAIKNKLKGYPEKIKDNVHRAKAYLPMAVAAILKKKPDLIAPAIQAFCNKDYIDMKACRAMKFFPPEQRVMTNVTFTKCLYAMLLNSKYFPDKRTGWNLPSKDSPQYKAHMLGIKIACGFEILIAQSKPNADIESDKGWHSYINNLKEKGYFKNLLEHSIEYNNLLNKAKEYYINHRDSIHYSPAIGQEILNLLKNLEYDIEEFKSEESYLPSDDDESWLNISPEELDKMLQERYGQKTIGINSNSDSKVFTDKVTNFLNHISDLEGVEFPNEANDVPVPPPRTKNKSKVTFSQDTKTEQNYSNNKIDFDANSFAHVVQNILNLVIPDDSWGSDSDMSEYEDDNSMMEQPFKETQSKMKEYMNQMDMELATTSIGQSFEKKQSDSFEDIENFQPVDIDMNSLKNILESYKSQLGEAGPSSSMLGPMGMHLDKRN